MTAAITTSRILPSLRESALVPVLVFVGMVVAIGSSLGAPLIPLIATSDGVSLSAAQWVLTCTYLVGAVATPLMGRLGDGPHRRGVIIVALAVVTAGGLFAALPLGFAFLLVGRGLQGVGLGLIPLTITVAREALPAERAKSASAVLSITTVAGIGLGYPITGLIAQVGGLHAAFWFGAAVSATALLLVSLVVPASRQLQTGRVDVLGAALLGAGLAGTLLALSEGEVWGWGSPTLLGVAAASLVLLVIWVRVELRRPTPLINLRLLRNPAVFTADAVAILAGVGMYLLISSVTRLVQTPTSTGYGLGEGVAICGLLLLPFSVGSVVAGRVVHLISKRLAAGTSMAFAGLVLLGGMAVFSLERDTLWEVFMVMGLAGLGVGSIYALMPALILRSVPLHETGSAMSFNQVLRYIGYGAGSTLCAVLLETQTTQGGQYPTTTGYTLIGLASIGVWFSTAVVGFLATRFETESHREAPQSDQDIVEIEEQSVAFAVPFREDGAGSSPLTKGR